MLSQAVPFGVGDVGMTLTKDGLGDDGMLQVQTVTRVKSSNNSSQITNRLE